MPSVVAGRFRSTDAASGQPTFPPFGSRIPIPIFGFEPIP
jgi:hypothetical protein